MKRKLKETRGATLVELIVTCALLALFGAAVIALLGRSTALVDKTSARARAQLVGELLLTKIAGELDGASPQKQARITVSDATDTAAAGTSLAFTDEGERPVLITVRDGGLLLRYLPDGEHAGTTDWTYDRAVYDGWMLPFGGLTFSPIGENILRISLTLQDAAGDAVYTAERYVQCYRFCTAEEQARIGYGALPALP